MQKAEASPEHALGYVPYQYWVEADPGITRLLQNSMQSFRHEGKALFLSFPPLSSFILP